MAGGERVRDPEPLSASRERAAATLACLPAHLRDLAPGEAPFTPEIHPELDALARETDAALGY